MKRKLCIVSLLCLVGLMMSGCESQEKKIATLTMRFDDKSEEVRRAALVQLRKIGKPSTVPALIKALSDEESQVRGYAVYALGRIGEPAKDAVPALIKALSHEDNRVRQNAAFALIEIGTPEAMKAVNEDNNKQQSRYKARGESGK